MQEFTYGVFVVVGTVVATLAITLVGGLTGLLIYLEVEEPATRSHGSIGATAPPLQRAA
jgi:uncharacterized membrane protein